MHTGINKIEEFRKNNPVRRFDYPIYDSNKHFEMNIL